MPIEERLLEEKRHHAGTSYSRIFIDMISIARRKLLMLSGVLVLCRLQVERINYHGPGLSAAIGAGIGASRRASQAGWNFRKGHLTGRSNAVSIAQTHGRVPVGV